MPDAAPGRDGAAAPVGLRQAVAEQLSLQAIVGGPRGIAESVLPMTVFTVVWAFTHDVSRSVIAALVPAVVLTVWRLVAREPVTQAIGGLLGIALGAGFALLTGRAQDFFVPGLIKNLGFAALYAVSSLVRYPLIGLLLGFALGEDLRWRTVPRRMRVYQQATWVWVAMFAIRALVQGRLYVQGDAATLGFVNLVLGLPLFGVAVALTWLIVRRVPPARADAPDPARPGREYTARDTAEADGPEPGADLGVDPGPDAGVSGGSARG